MKTRILRFAVAAAVCAVSSLGASAQDDMQDFEHDFEQDGIYYDFLSEVDKTVAVAEAPFEAPYSGDVVIPSQVNYNGNTYTVTEIGSYAFCQSNITSVKIPTTIKTIDDYAFYYCGSLTEGEIPESVENICRMAFGSCGITSIQLPNTLKTIGEEAFSKSKLVSIEIPASVESIGDLPFAWVESLTAINVVAGNKNYCSIDGVLYGKAVTSLIACPAMKTEIEIPGTVSAIEEAAFAYCRNLKNFVMPESLTAIGEGAFEGCISLTKMELPDNLQTVGDAAFDSCTGLESVSFGNKLKDFGLDTFWGCSSLVNVTIDEANETFVAIDNVVYARQGAMSPDGMVLLWCPAGRQTSVTIPDGVSSIYIGAFCECKNLESVEIPNSVQEIGDQAFDGCISLTEIALPENLSRVGEDVFYDCKKLSKVTFAKNTRLKEIGECMFYGCISLETFIVPDSITLINSGAFAGCENLSTVTIGSKVKILESGAFQGCTSLKYIYCKPVTPPSTEMYSDGVYTFEQSVYSTAMLHVPVGSAYNYKAADIWKYFEIIVETDFAGVEDAVASDGGVKVFAADGTIVVGGVADGTMVEVYGIGGGCVYRGTAGTISGLPAGIYVVRAAGQVTKVMLK